MILQKQAAIEKAGDGSPRLHRIKSEYNKAVPSICIERAVLFTRSHQETGGAPLILRRAKAFKKACEEIPAIIFPDELLVGTPGKERRSACINPEVSWRWVEEEMDRLEVRDQDPYQIAPGQKHTIMKSNPFPTNAEKVHEHSSQKTGFSK